MDMIIYQLHTNLNSCIVTAPLHCTKVNFTRVISVVLLWLAELATWSCGGKVESKQPMEREYSSPGNQVKLKSPNHLTDKTQLVPNGSSVVMAVTRDLRVDASPFRRRKTP